MVLPRRRPLRIRGYIAACLLAVPALAWAETAPAAHVEPVAAAVAAPARVDAAAPVAVPGPTPSPAEGAGIAAAPAAAALPEAAPAPAPEAAPTAAPAAAAAAPAVVPEAPAKTLDDDSGEDSGDDGDDGDDSGDEGGESESHQATEQPAIPGVHYTQDLPDAEIERLWREEPTKLGSVSLGFTDRGRLINGEAFPEGEHWTVVDPKNCYATSETIEYLKAAINRVVEQYPDSEPLRVNHISRQEGGWLRPHKSHQAGRDADLAFYYRPGAVLKKGKGRETVMDVPRNWALLKAVITLTDVQLILVDRKIQKVLYDYALSTGENRAWLDSIFHASKQSLIQHARRHKDHFHVRFFNPRAQELGRRLQPLMGKVRPDENFAMHKVRRGETLGAIARKYKSAVVAIRKANGMKGNALHVGMVLSVPTRGPCVRCPIPPEVVVPPRRLPPAPPAMAMDPLNAAVVHP